MTGAHDTDDSGLAETLDSFRTGEEISEGDAMTIAKTELVAVRNESYDHEPLRRTAASSAAEIEAEFSG
ncbi:hypothetical protein GCM10027062_39460 [Nocardioides hungaricus]